jgi:hypothetical protein
VLLVESAHQRILDKIVGSALIPQQRPRVAPKARDLAFEKRAKIGHRDPNLLLLN